MKKVIMKIDGMEHSIDISEIFKMLDDGSRLSREMKHALLGDTFDEDLTEILNDNDD